ncbi:hypothetical protein GIB67_005765 [Kingdonia uniflora]|uniref:NAB domain-containing protein n=1 Tax=Kingdonia uniflora TaxID=39325 RepID=A0A7J7KVI2_9MAGN|nr:hypothetical protein GIB67_005765 [Kingdonia uniflora]
MLELLQDEGDTIAQRAEMYYKKKPELVRIMEELHRSFCALAERFDPFRSDFIRVTRLGSSSSSSNSFGSSGQTKLETPNLHPKSILEDPNTEGNTSKFGVEYINKMPHDVHSPEPSRLNNMIKINIKNEQKEANDTVNELDLG